jgi:hypothetical protein
MRVKYNGRDYSLEDYIYKNLGGEDYGRGSIETVEVTIINIRNMLSVLVNKLADEDKLDADDIKQMLGSNCYYEIKLERGN